MGFWVCGFVGLWAFECVGLWVCVFVGVGLWVCGFVGCGVWKKFFSWHPRAIIFAVSGFVGVSVCGFMVCGFLCVWLYGFVRLCVGGFVGLWRVARGRSFLRGIRAPRFPRLFRFVGVSVCGFLGFWAFVCVRLRVLCVDGFVGLSVCGSWFVDFCFSW